MKWLPRRRKVKLDKPVESEAATEIKVKLREVRAQWREVNSLVDRLGTLNEQNHYSSIITEAMRGGNK